MDRTDVTLQELREAILEYDAAQAEALAERSVREGIPQLEALAVLTSAIREVGDAFGRGDAFLPDLVGAAKALEAALPVLKAALLETGEPAETRGVVVLGTVQGDVHTIGKAMVGALLTANGCEVHDLGVDVPAADFVTAVREHSAQVLAMSALLTSTAIQIGPVVEALKEAGLRDAVTIAAGGGAVNSELARSMGADVYHPTAPGGVDLILATLGK